MSSWVLDGRLQKAYCRLLLHLEAMSTLWNSYWTRKQISSNDGFSVLLWAVIGTRCCRTKTKMSVRLRTPISPRERCYYDGSETHDSNLDAESLAVLRLLISRGADPYSRTRHDETLLRFAVGSLQIVSFLIDVGLEVDAVDIEGRTPLHNVAELGFAPVVNRLLDADSDPNKATLIGETALHTAVFWGSPRTFGQSTQHYPDFIEARSKPL